MWRLLAAAPHGQIPPLAVLQLGSCASSRCTFRLWIARHSQGEAQSLGARPLPRALERAASKAADFTAFDNTGKEKGSIFDALEDMDYQACLDKCVAISKA